MKNFLIIYPNWLPSNAVGVQRVRLIVNFIEEFGWRPVIVAVKPEYYEEEKSDDLLKLLRANVEVEFVEAAQPGNLRLYGDISLRAFGNLKRKAIEIINRQKIHCMWISVAPFYTALIGRKVHDITGVPYVIDYQDPWVHDFPGSRKLFSRARFASLVSKVLEPVAVGKASAFTGVSPTYYMPVLQRNSRLKNVPHTGMPLGFDPYDYTLKPANEKLLWSDDGDVKPYVYAGALLPHAHLFISQLFRIIAEMRSSSNWDSKVRFYFVGTGRTNLNSVAHYAKQHGIDDIVHEKQERISYLEILNNISGAAGVLVIGSTEEHYTASKIFQSLLCGKPVFSVFHYKSPAIPILQETGADNYLVTYRESESHDVFENRLQTTFHEYLALKSGWSPQLNRLEKYSARSSAKALADVLDKVILNREK